MEGNEVKKIRQFLKLTQEEFSHKLGVTLCNVNRLENNKTVPSRLAKKQIHQLMDQEGMTH